MQLPQLQCQLGMQHEAILWQGQAQIIVVSLETSLWNQTLFSSLPALHYSTHEYA